MKVGVLITARMKSERLKFKALKKLNGHITNVASTLQISRGALYKKIKEYKLK